MPNFSLRTGKGKILGITTDGTLYATFGKIERQKFLSDETRYEFVNDLKKLNLLPHDLSPDDVVSGRNLTKKLGQLSDDEFENLLKLLEEHLVSNVKLGN